MSSLQELKAIGDYVNISVFKKVVKNDLTQSVFSVLRSTAMVLQFQIGDRRVLCHRKKPTRLKTLKRSSEDEAK
jgi:hypothetical protein